MPAFHANKKQPEETRSNVAALQRCRIIGAGAVCTADSCYFSYLFRDEPAHECHNISRQHATKTKRPAAHSCYRCLHAFLGKAQCTNTGHKFPNNQPTTSVAPPRNRPFALFVMTNHWSSNFHLIEAVSEGTKRTCV